jgi:hypothetical protein
LIAIVISIISYFKNSNLDRRQIRVHKLEEMIEIIILIISNYHSFDDLYLLQRKIELSKDDQEINLLLEKEAKYVEALKQISNDIKLRENIIRLGILANIYLPNTDLKNRVKSLISLISCLHERTVNRNLENTFPTFKTYPRAWILKPYIETLLVDLSREMNLGYENNMFGENPHFDKFKKELKIE